jgi:hypothetical protein
MKKIIGLMILGALGFAAASSPLIGTWKLNVAKSTFSPGPAPQSETVVRGTDNKVTVSGVNEKGERENWSYVSTPGGSPISGVPDATVVETRKGNIVDDVWKIGKATQRGHGVVSRDGRTMVYTISGTDADGKKMSNRSVYEKQ